MHSRHWDTKETYSDDMEFDMKETYSDDMECDQSDFSDMDEAESKYDESQLCWLGDEEEGEMDIQYPEQQMGEEREDRILFNPASLARKTSIPQQKSFSHVPYPKEDMNNTDVIFHTLQVKQKTTSLALLQMLYCLSSVMQTQIKEDEDSPNEFARFPQYDVPFSSLPVESGGDYESFNDVPREIMEREDMSTKPYILQGAVPLFMTVFRFMIHVYEQVKYDGECNIMALVYINRITTAHNMALTNRNWRILWLLAIMIAQKVWANKPLRSAGFVALFEDLRKSVIKEAELSMMSMLDYNTGVPPSLYAKYYLELNELYNCLLSHGEEVWEPVPDFTKALLKRKCFISEEKRGQYSVKKSRK